MSNRTVAVVGPGAIGATFAAVAQQSGHDVALFGRTRVSGITVAMEHAAPVVLQAPVQTDPRAVRGPVDWVLLAVKAHQTEAAAPWIERLAGPRTVVAVLQNGVDQEGRVGPYAGAATVLPTVVWCPVEASAKDRIHVRGRPALTVPDTAPGHALARLLTGRATVEPDLDFPVVQWRKLAINAVAALQVLTGQRAGMYRRSDVRALTRAYLSECLAVARAVGVNLPERVADEITDWFVGLPPHLGTSILFDREAGVPLEWDARNGVVQRLGRRHGVPTPISDVLVPLLAAASDG